jgi:hypothetical protein
MKLKTTAFIAGLILAMTVKGISQNATPDSIRVHIMQNENGTLTSIDTVVPFSQHDQLHAWLLTKGIDEPTAPVPPATVDGESMEVEVAQVLTEDISGDSSHQVILRMSDENQDPSKIKNMKIILLPDDPKAPLPPLPPVPPAPPGMKMRTPIPPDAPKVTEPGSKNDVQIIILRDSTGMETHQCTRTVIINGPMNTPSTPANPSTEKKMQESKDVTIYPNPSNGHITLNIDMPGKDETNIRVIDMNGKTVYTESLGETEGKVSKEIDLSKNGKGIYNVEVRKGGNVVIERVVVQ